MNENIDLRGIREQLAKLWNKVAGVISSAVTLPIAESDVTNLVSDLAAKASITYVDGLVVGLWDDRGNFDASINAYPSAGGSAISGAILKGDVWTISVAGTLPTGQAVEVGDIVRALINTPGNAQANWAIQQNNIGYVAENTANKDLDGTLAANSDVKYPSQKAVKTYVDTEIAGVGSGGISVLEAQIFS